MLPLLAWSGGGTAAVKSEEEETRAAIKRTIIIITPPRESVITDTGQRKSEDTAIAFCDGIKLFSIL